VPLGYAGVGGWTFALSQVIIVNPLSWYASGLPFDEWYRLVFFCGVRKMAYSFTKLSRSNPDEVKWWEHGFNFYWSFCIQYLIPAVLWFVFVGNIYERASDPTFQDEAQRFHIAAIIILVIGFMVFICPAICGVYNIDTHEEDIFFDKATSYDQDVN